jgi:hypothetical protein
VRQTCWAHCWRLEQLKWWDLMNKERTEQWALSYDE